MRAGDRCCPACGEAVAARPSNPHRPFCSSRCRLVDLGRWMGESYRIPGELAGDGAGRAAGEGEEDA